MRLIEQVVALVEEMGQATVDDLMPDIEGDYSRRQVQVCLRNATYTKRLVTLERGATLGRYGGTLPSLYGPAKPKEAPRPVSSVFEMGDRAAKVFATSAPQG
jgi:hypothetical protein